jgi:hypothetical protein
MRRPRNDAEQSVRPPLLTFHMAKRPYRTSKNAAPAPAAESARHPIIIKERTIIRRQLVGGRSIPTALTNAQVCHISATKRFAAC